MLNGKVSRLLRKGMLCLGFATAAVSGANAAVASAPPDTPPQTSAFQVVHAPDVDITSMPAFRALAPADPNASPTTSAVFNYLTDLPNKSDHRLISGQWTGYGSVDNAEIQGIDKLTGQKVGLVGADYHDFSGPPIHFSDINFSMINYWNQGSLVDIDVHYPNPWTGGGPQDRTVINFKDVITPGTPAYNAYMANLDMIAAGLQQLQDAGVVVLFRPMMEMDGNWFWWGQQKDFPKLWAQTFDYLTKTKGLHNLLWVYSTAGRAPLDYYPGAEYVDIVGCDAYGYGTSGGKAYGYDVLLTTGKPIALSELGLQSYVYKTETDPPYDLFTAIRNIKSNMSEAVYFMAWSNAKGDSKNYWGIDAQLNASAALNDAWVQNGVVPWKPLGAEPLVVNQARKPGVDVKGPSP